MSEKTNGNSCGICGGDADEKAELIFYPIKHEDRSPDLYRAIINFETYEYGENENPTTGDVTICVDCFLRHCIDKLPRVAARLMYRDGHHAYEESSSA